MSSTSSAVDGTRSRRTPTDLAPEGVAGHPGGQAEHRTRPTRPHGGQLEERKEVTTTRGVAS